MSLDLTYDDLFNSNFVIEDNKIILSQSDLLKKIIGLPASFSHWLIVVHECLRKAFLPYIIIDDDHNFLSDKNKFVVSDYTEVYTNIDCITLGKRLTLDSIVLGYQWKFTNSFESTINENLLLLETNDSNLFIHLGALNFPDNPVDFCQAFVNYLAVNEAKNITVNTNYLVEFFFSNNLPPLRLEDVING